MTTDPLVIESPSGISFINGLRGMVGIGVAIGISVDVGIVVGKAVAMDILIGLVGKGSILTLLFVPPITACLLIACTAETKHSKTTSPTKTGRRILFILLLNSS
jgi:hypothetical protein